MAAAVSDSQVNPSPSSLLGYSGAVTSKQCLRCRGWRGWGGDPEGQGESPRGWGNQGSAGGEVGEGEKPGVEVEEGILTFQSSILLLT